MLTADRPISQGVANVLKRAAQFARLRWTPIEKMPKCVDFATPNAVETIPDGFFDPWLPVLGLPYSYSRDDEKFIGYNVSLETFISALGNPKSVLYQRNLTRRGARMSCYYGIVSSSFASYAYGFPTRRFPTLWAALGDMQKIDSADPDDLRLGDSLLSLPLRHLALITGIERNILGRTAFVTISESSLPTIRVVRFTREEFIHFYLDMGYIAYRYRDIDKVPYTPSPFVHLKGDPECAPYCCNRVLLPDYGDKANYHLGSPVQINVMEEGWEELIVADAEDRTVRKLHLTKAGVYPLWLEQCGMYRAFCRRGEEVSSPVSFCMTDFSTRITGNGSYVDVSFFHADDAEILSLTVFRRGTNETVRTYEKEPSLSADKVLHIDDLPKGSYALVAVASNAYGCYEAAPVTFSIV